MFKNIRIPAVSIFVASGFISVAIAVISGVVLYLVMFAMVEDSVLREGANQAAAVGAAVAASYQQIEQRREELIKKFKMLHRTRNLSETIGDDPALMNKFLKDEFEADFLSAATSHNVQGAEISVLLPRGLKENANASGWATYSAYSDVMKDGSRSYSVRAGAPDGIGASTSYIDFGTMEVDSEEEDGTPTTEMAIDYTSFSLGDAYDVDADGWMFEWGYKSDTSHAIVFNIDRFAGPDGWAYFYANSYRYFYSLSGAGSGSGSGSGAGGGVGLEGTAAVDNSNGGYLAIATVYQTVDTWYDIIMRTVGGNNDDGTHVILVDPTTGYVLASTFSTDRLRAADCYDSLDDFYADLEADGGDNLCAFPKYSRSRDPLLREMVAAVFRPSWAEEGLDVPAVSERRKIDGTGYYIVAQQLGNRLQMRPFLIWARDEGSVSSSMRRTLVIVVVLSSAGVGLASLLVAVFTAVLLLRPLTRLQAHMLLLTTLDFSGIASVASLHERDEEELAAEKAYEAARNDIATDEDGLSAEDDDDDVLSGASFNFDDGGSEGGGGALALVPATGGVGAAAKRKGGAAAAGAAPPKPEPRSFIEEISSLQKNFQQMAKAVLSFGKYVPQDVVRELMATGAVAESRMAEGRLTVLFSDIQGFTTLCERINSPDKVSKLLTLFFSAMTARLLAHGATIDKFIGDCIMCFWGAPLRVDNPNFRALCAGLDLIHTARQLDKTFRRHKVRLGIRVGAHAGRAMVGNIGSDDRINYTAMGDVVNTASRLEGANKTYGSSFLASEEVLMGSKRSGLFAHRYVGALALKGKRRRTAAFHVCGVRFAALEPDGGAEVGSGGGGAAESVGASPLMPDGRSLGGVSGGTPAGVGAPLSISRLNQISNHHPNPNATPTTFSITGISASGSAQHALSSGGGGGKAPHLFMVPATTTSAAAGGDAHDDAQSAYTRVTGTNTGTNNTGGNTSGNSTSRLSGVRDVLPLHGCYNVVAPNASLRPQLTEACARFGQLARQREDALTRLRYTAAAAAGGGGGGGASSTNHFHHSTGNNNNNTNASSSSPLQLFAINGGRSGGGFDESSSNQMTSGIIGGGLFSTSNTVGLQSVSGGLHLHGVRPHHKYSPRHQRQQQQQQQKGDDGADSDAHMYATIDDVAAVGYSLPATPTASVPQVEPLLHVVSEGEEGAAGGAAASAATTRRRTRAFEGAAPADARQSSSSPTPPPLGSSSSACTAAAGGDAFGSSTDADGAAVVRKPSALDTTTAAGLTATTGGGAENGESISFVTRRNSNSCFDSHHANVAGGGGGADGGAYSRSQSYGDGGGAAASRARNFTNSGTAEGGNNYNNTKNTNNSSSGGAAALDGGDGSEGAAAVAAGVCAPFVAEMFSLLEAFEAHCHEEGLAEERRANEEWAAAAAAAAAAEMTAASMSLSGVKLADGGSNGDQQQQQQLGMSVSAGAAAAALANSGSSRQQLAGQLTPAQRRLAAQARRRRAGLATNNSSNTKTCRTSAVDAVSAATGGGTSVFIAPTPPLGPTSAASTTATAAAHSADTRGPRGEGKDYGRNGSTVVEVFHITSDGGVATPKVADTPTSLSPTNANATADSVAPPQLFLPSPSSCPLLPAAADTTGTVAPPNPHASSTKGGAAAAVAAGGGFVGADVSLHVLAVGMGVSGLIPPPVEFPPPLRVVPLLRGATSFVDGIRRVRRAEAEAAEAEAVPKGGDGTHTEAPTTGAAADQPHGRRGGNGGAPHHSPYDDPSSPLFDPSAAVLPFAFMRPAERDVMNGMLRDLFGRWGAGLPSGGAAVMGAAAGGGHH